MKCTRANPAGGSQPCRSGCPSPRTPSGGTACLLGIRIRHVQVGQDVHQDLSPAGFGLGRREPGEISAMPRQWNQSPLRVRHAGQRHIVGFGYIPDNFSILSSIWSCACVRWTVANSNHRSANFPVLPIQWITGLHTLHHTSSILDVVWVGTGVDFGNFGQLTGHLPIPGSPAEDGYFGKPGCACCCAVLKLPALVCDFKSSPENMFDIEDKVLKKRTSPYHGWNPSRSQGPLTLDLQRKGKM
eukprot:TRINITY_DN19013_c0_g1_i4.p1 TRINITY_DN19013_c0_g1~~TRINITY_DN19013_c0_g1_i4.p1  ORF type:complete len:243 (+),score=25.98 TRINITY_DN19013_c0_g1_i4:34-762(+)